MIAAFDLLSNFSSNFSAALVDLFAAPRPALPLALGRLALGLVLTVDGVKMLREHGLWYADDGLRRRLGDEERLPPALDLFAWAEQLGLSSRAVLWTMVISALAFALGLATPISGVLLLLALLAIPPRNLLVVYGGDAFARTTLLLLLLSPCAASLSVDALLREGSLALTSQRAPWAGRLIVFEVALLYLYNFLCKLPNSAWRRGLVMFDLLRNRDFARADVPTWLKTAWASRALTWGALAAELAFAPGLLIPQTAALCCLAAVAFHLTIARLLDVHLFSQVMAATLLACLPGAWLLDALGLAPALVAAPSPTRLDALTQGAGVALCLAYAVYAVFWAPPWRSRVSRALRRPLAPFLDRLHWVRGWRLFTNSCPQQLDIELVMLDARGELTRWQWNRADALVRPSPELAARPTVPGHRFQRFKFALVDREDARERLIARFRRELEGAGLRPRAVSIDALFVDVRGARPIVGGRSLHTQLAARGRGEGVDFDALAQLACAVRCPPTRVKLLELLLLTGLRAAREDRARDGLGPALELVLRDRAARVRPPALPARSLAGLRRMCAQVPDPDERARLSQALTAIERATSGER